MRRLVLPAALALALGCGGGKVDTVVRKPVASFVATQSSVRPQVFNLDASQSNATVGELTAWVWTSAPTSQAPSSVVSGSSVTTGR